jgi:hypothetical protein
VSSTPTQSTDIHYVHSSTNPNGNQQPGGNKKKGCGNNCKGGRNDNKAKDNANNYRLKFNVGEGNKEKRKVKFPCNIYTYYHLTHLCPKLEEATRILSLPPSMMTSPFPHNKHMASSSFNVGNVVSGIQNHPTHEGDRLCVNMVKSQINVATQSHDYSSS